MPLVSFVVPVRDRAALLERCLGAIRRSAGAIEHEIVVVDDDSRDGSRAVAIAAGARVVEGGGEPLGSLRNRGAREARGELLAFVDADVLLGPCWVSAMLDLLAAEGAAAAGAACSAPPDGNWVQRTYDLLRGRAAQRRWVRWVPSGAMAVRADPFRSAGGFDSSLSSCEDVDLCRRLRAAGHGIASGPGLESVHCDDPRTLRALFAAEVRRGAANLRVSLRRRALGEMPSLLVSAAVLALLVLLVPAMVAAAAGEALPLYALSAALAAPLAVRAMRMTRAGGWRRLPASLVVATVYEVGRAVALVVGGVSGATTRSGPAPRIAP